MAKMEVWKLVNAFIASDYGQRDYLLEFYSPKLLYSTEARLNWLEPNLKELL